MKSFLDKVLCTAKLNEELQASIDVCLKKNRAYIGAVLVLEFTYPGNIPPAFCIGFRLRNVLPLLDFPMGVIFVSKAMISSLTKEELKFVIYHELGHIMNSHSIVSALMLLGKKSLINYLARKLQWKYREVENLIGLIKKIYSCWTKKNTIEEVLQAQNELEADKFAVVHQRKKKPALSVLYKISSGIIERPSHFTKDGAFKMPVITFRRRMIAIGNLRLPQIRILRKRIKRVVR